MKQRMALMLSALWWGGMSALSFLAVPTLFARLGAPVAGPVAAHFFSVQCWVSLAIGLALLMLMGREVKRSTLIVALVAMALAMLQEFAVAQKIVTARATGGDLRLWHGLGSLMVLGQWLCAGILTWRLSRGTGRP
ncbi:MAG: DUF4149 domain-containing protein [Hydrogenophaga sp.]|nr:DUF4149 domain-containing protein [Hydrogenophaga sp.]